MAPSPSLFSHVTGACVWQLLLIVLSLSVVHAWDYGDFLGPASWNISFPLCDEMLSSQTQSPIQVGEAADIAQNISKHIEFARKASTHQHTWESKFSIGQAPGGPLIVFNAVAGKEVHLSVTTHTTLSAGEVESSTEDDLVIAKVVLHSGVEHRDIRRQDLFPGEFEAQVFISVDINEDTIPKYILAVTFSSRSGAPASNTTDVLGDILVSTATAFAQFRDLPQDRAFVSVVSTSQQVLPPAADFSEVFGYQGRQSYPPCSGEAKSTMVLFATASVLPLSTISTYTSLLSDSPSATQTVRPLQTRGNRTVEKLSMSFAAGTLPVSTVLEEVMVKVVHTEGETNIILRNVIVALGISCLAVLGYITLLLSARAGYVDVPTWLGGLKKPVQFWTNPPTAHRRIAFGVGDDSGSSYDDEDEGDDEEDEYDVARVDGPQEQEEDSEVSMSEDSEES